LGCNVSSTQNVNDFIAANRFIALGSDIFFT